MEIIKKTGLKTAFSVLLCLVIILSSINASSAMWLGQENLSGSKQEGENPVLMVDYYAEGKPLDFFNYTPIENGLIVSFMNSSKNSETVDILVYVAVWGVKGLTNITLSVDGGAIITSVNIDLCDNDFNIISSYGTYSVDKEEIVMNIDGEGIASEAENVGATCVKFTISISNWSENTEHHLRISAGGPGEGPGEYPPEERPNVFVFYDDQLGILAYFNVSFTDEGLFITFSNTTAESSIIDVYIVAELRAIEYLTGFNATIDNGATIETVSIDLYNDNLTIIENYQTYNFGTPDCSVPFDAKDVIERARNVSASFVGFKITIGNWMPDTLYTLHIIPFFAELLYYETEDTIYVDPSVMNLPPEIRVWWRLYNDTWGWNWTYQDISWEFGPRAHYEIFCYNTSTGIWYEVTRATWIMLNAPVKINITIPKLLFEEGTELGRIELTWNMWAINISASLSINYDHTLNQWYTWSSIINSSNPDPYSSSTGEFFTLNQSQTIMVETSEKYEIMIVGQFNDLTPVGIYYVYLNLFDNMNNYIGSSSMYYWDSELSLYKEVAIGGPWDEVAVYYDTIYGGTYLAEVLNTEYNAIYSIGINQTFIIRLNITGISDAEFRNASVMIQLPYSLKTYVNITGWHEEYRVYHGGWIYNETLDTYVWDPNATIITREWVFGTYLGKQWVDISKEVNVTYYYWDDTTGEYYPETITTWTSPYLLLFYNNTDGTFSYYLLYEYWNQTLKEDEGGQYIEYVRCWEIEDIPPEIRFYEFLNGTKTIEENKIVLEFKGKFVGNPGEDLWLNYRVFSDKGEIWPRDWEWMYEKASRISVEKPVIDVKIEDANGEISGSWYYATEPGQWFIVKAVIEGGSKLVTDVDGIRVRFNCWDWYWSENETIWMNVEIIATINLRENTTEVIVYNETNKEVYEYGTYEIWNETTGMMEEVEGWHWEHYSFNQTSGEWVNTWLGWHSKDTVINKPYIIVNGFTTFTTEDGKYVIQVNMSFTEYANDRMYSFSVNLLNWTYGEDYSKPWGEHLVEDWTYSVVYTLNNGTVEVYVPKPEQRDYAETSNGDRYLIFTKPYILINGEKLPLKEIKYWNGYQYEYRLLREEWDPTTGEYKRYYILENGTKIFVYEAYHAFIYNVTIQNETSGTTFTILTYMQYPWWNEFKEAQFLFTLEGEIICLNNCYISTTERIDRILLEFAGYFTLINGTTWVNLKKGWIDWDYLTYEYYILLENGTKIYVKYDHQYMYRYYFEKDGKRYYIEWPTAYYVGNYNGRTVIVPDWFKRSWYYTFIGEEKVELPYEGVSREYEWICWWDLQKPESQYGVVPEDEYALVNGTLYLINYYSNTSSDGYIVVNGEIINVTKRQGIYTKISGKDVWNIVQIGFKMFLGNLTKQGTYDRENLLELIVASYDDTNNQITLLNGTVLDIYHNYRVAFYEVKVNGTTYYTATYEPYWYWENKSGVIESGYALFLLNGSKLKLESYEDYEFVGIVTVELGEYTYSEPTNFTWNGETYNTTIETEGYGTIYLLYDYWCVNVSGVLYDVISYDWLLHPEYWGSIPPRFCISFYDYNETFGIYNVTVDGVEYTIYPNVQHIKAVRLSWGYPVNWHLDELWEDVSYKQAVWNVVVGSPEWGLWGYRRWTIVPETGALDLDGDLTTTDDQFYVKRVYVGEFGWNETVNGLDVNIVYDPNPVIPGDELIIDAWMGTSTNTYWNRWNETYYWYYTNMTPVSPETMAMINETLWDTERNSPKPGYWDIARMTRNMTWEDYLKKAQEEGWDWVQEEVTWTWLWFGFQQSYWVSTGENETFQSYYVNLRYEYAGMFIYNDTNGNMIMDENEATHYFIPNAVGNLTFTTPGEAFGIYNDTGTLVLPINESIEFGISYLDINGTMFPFGRSYYAWYGEEIYGTDLHTFKERPVDASVEELSFKLHFYVENSTETNSTEAHIKIDQHVGNWDLDLPTGIAVLENLSLSINYYVYAETSGSWEVRSENGTPITPEQIVEASRISLDASGIKFAEVNMGDTYLWGGNLSMPCNVSSHTVPLSTFVETYTDYESETSIGGWTFQSTMYFLSVGFPKWDGYFVYEDPEVVVYSGKQKKTVVGSIAEFLANWIPTVGKPGEGGEQPPSEEIPLFFLIIIAMAVIGVAAVIYKKKRRAKSVANVVKVKNK